MIKTMLHDRKTGETRWGDQGLFAEWASNPDLWIWADFAGEEPLREKALFQETFALDPLVVAYAQRDCHTPKLEVFDDYFFLLMNGLDATTTDIDFKTIQIAVFVGDRFLLTGHKELADDLMNGYYSVTSHRLNQIMKVLTVVTVVFLPLTLLVGIYGMNFEDMPELKLHNAYYVLLGVMASIVIALLLVFRRIRWL